MKPSARATPPYVSLAWLRMTPRMRRVLVKLPPASASISTHKHKRSTLGRSEQRFDESGRGSIGMARSGRYTLTPRAFASASIIVPGVTYALTSAIAIHALYPPSPDRSTQTASS